MCGIFGYVGTKLNVRDLYKVAQANLSRGDQAVGVAWIDPDLGTLKMRKQPGNWMRNPELLAELAADKPAMLIGHTRWSTNGNPAFNVNNHPHAADGGWVVHNGVITEYQGLIRRFGLNPVSKCDSEVIGLLAEQSTLKTRQERLAQAIETVRAETARMSGLLKMAVLGLWNRPNRMVAYRTPGQPLYIIRQGNGVWFSSVAVGIGEIYEHTTSAVWSYGPDSWKELEKSSQPCTKKVEVWDEHIRPRSERVKSIVIRSKPVQQLTYEPYPQDWDVESTATPIGDEADHGGDADESLFREIEEQEQQGIPFPKFGKFTCTENGTIIPDRKARN